VSIGAQDLLIERGALDAVDVEDEIQRALRAGSSGEGFEEATPDVREAADALPVARQRDRL
jgi:hypothetical protein